MALGDIDRPFAWQSWHLWHWAGSDGALGPRLAPWLRGTWRHRPSLCMAGVALRDRRGTWPHRPVTLRGRRGTSRHRSSLRVAGVALIALGWLWWCAWAPFGAVGAAAVCVAGVALGHIDRHFAWQVWHLWHWAGSSVGMPVLATYILTYLHTYILTYIHTYIHACIHTCMHTYIHTYHLFTHHLSLSHNIFHIRLCPTQLFLLLDPSPPPLSFLPSPSRYNICCSLLEEVMWGYPVL